MCYNKINLKQLSKIEEATFCISEASDQWHCKLLVYIIVGPWAKPIVRL